MCSRKHYLAAAHPDLCQFLGRRQPFHRLVNPPLRYSHPLMSVEILLLETAGLLAKEVDGLADGAARYRPKSLGAPPLSPSPMRPALGRCGRW